MIQLGPNPVAATQFSALFDTMQLQCNRFISLGRSHTSDQSAIPESG